MLAAVAGASPSGCIPWLFGAGADCQIGSVAPSTYGQGTATIVTTGGQTGTVTLGLDGGVVGAAYETCPVGAHAGWTGSDGKWVLVVLADGQPNPGFGGQPGTLWIEDYRVEPPLHANGDSCVITIDTISAEQLKGRATCHGLRWLNAYEEGSQPELASPLPDHPAFDAEISFEASK